jgi:hypothetical protein
MWWSEDICEQNFSTILRVQQTGTTYVPLGIGLDVFTGLHTRSMVAMGQDIMGKVQQRQTGRLHCRRSTEDRVEGGMVVVEVKERWPNIWPWFVFMHVCGMHIY